VKRYSIAEARDNLAALVHDAEQADGIELTRRGKPVAVILSLTEYERLQAGRQDFWEAYQQFRDEFNLATLGLEPELFSGLRDSSPGREFEW
jgi:prevent-host-death family protein